MANYLFKHRKNPLVTTLVNRQDRIGAEHGSRRFKLLKRRRVSTNICQDSHAAYVQPSQKLGGRQRIFRKKICRFHPDRLAIFLGKLLVYSKNRVQNLAANVLRRVPLEKGINSAKLTESLEIRAFTRNIFFIRARVAHGIGQIALARDQHLADICHWTVLLQNRRIYP